jgi:Bacterial EndoU nuclease
MPICGGSWPVSGGRVLRGRRAIVSLSRRRHILGGDGTGGGHRAGTAIPGKTEFPRSWSDDKVIAEIESIANDPTSRRSLQPNGRMRVEGMREGIMIRVIINTDGTSIWTAHPTNRPRNP